MTLFSQKNALWKLPLSYSNPARRAEQDKLDSWRERGGRPVTWGAGGGGGGSLLPPSSPNSPLMRPVFGVISRNHSAEH